METKRGMHQSTVVPAVCWTWALNTVVTRRPEAMLSFLRGMCDVNIMQRIQRAEISRQYGVIKGIIQRA